MFANVNWRKEYDIFCTGPMLFLELYTIILLVLAPRLPQPSTQGMLIMALATLLFSIWFTGLERLIRSWVITYRYSDFTYAEAALSAGYLLGIASIPLLLRLGMPILDAVAVSVVVELLLTGLLTILFGVYARLHAYATDTTAWSEPATE